MSLSTNRLESLLISFLDILMLLIHTLTMSQHLGEGFARSNLKSIPIPMNSKHKPIFFEIVTPTCSEKSINNFKNMLRSNKLSQQLYQFHQCHQRLRCQQFATNQNGDPKDLQMIQRVLRLMLILESTSLHR